MAPEKRSSDLGFFLFFQNEVRSNYSLLGGGGRGGAGERRVSMLSVRRKGEGVDEKWKEEGEEE